MKANKRDFLGAGFGAAVLLVADAASAGLVHIQVQQRAGTEFGAGYTVGRGSDCFVVTPFHVVQFAGADSITITDAKGSSAKARLLKGSEEFDAGLLQVAVPHTLDCPADWSDGANAAGAIGGAPFLVARKVDDTGRVMQTRFFASSTSREQVELQPFGPNDALREGDSGSTLFAGDQVVGLVVSVDTKSGVALALTQSQIHGLFGGDVLPGARRTAVMQPFTYRRAEEPYATVAAREYLAGAAGLELTSLAADGSVPAGVEYVVAGQIVDLNAVRQANPNYKPPEKADDSASVGRQLLRRLEQKVSTEVDEALDRNTAARYLRVFSIDVQVEITKLADNSKIVNLERRSYELPEIDATADDLQKTAVADATRDALALTLQKYPL
jgi:S1-C subfamily serine protease